MTEGGERSVLSQGAEATVYNVRFCGKQAVAKERRRKSYRHPALDDKLTIRRLHQEARGILKARKLGVRAPALFSIDSLTHTITCEFVEGKILKDVLLEMDAGGASLAEEARSLARLIGVGVARLHDGGLIHGDLTTSNMIFSGPSHEVGQTGCSEVAFIDFGLSFNSAIAEDKAVDLYVLERAFLSLHSNHQGMMDAVLESYKSSSKFWSPTMNKFGQVRMRGRKRVMIG